MSRPDFTLTWAGSRPSIPSISAGNYAAGWDTYLGPLPPLGDDHDYVMNLQDRRAVWLGGQMLKTVGHEWQADVSYNQYAVTRSPVNGQLYRSLSSGNIGNEPSVSGAKWALGVAETSDLLNTTRVNVASDSTVNLTTAAPNTRHINITGTTTINGFTVAVGQCYFVRFNAALTLVGGTNIITNRSGSITTALGDTCIIRAVEANKVEVLSGNFKSDAAADLLDTARLNVASASTVNLTTAAPNTRHINITGTATINEFIIAVGQCYFVRFAASLTLASGSSLLTNRSGNISVAAGDTCIIRATAANVVEVLSGNFLSEAAVGTRGQTWQNVQANRSANVAYTNTTGRAISVSISVYTLDGVITTLSVDGLVVARRSFQSASYTDATLQLTAIVPAGSSYALNTTNSTINVWAELR